MHEIILGYQGEMSLKGLNRNQFESAMMKILRYRLKTVGKFKVYCTQSTFYMEPEEEDVDMDLAFDRVSKVFGLASLSRAVVCDKDFDTICQTAEEYLGASLHGIRTFKVEARRSDKSYPMTSPELMRELGAYLLGKHNYLKVDVHNPQFKVIVEIRDYGAYIHGPKIPGEGGLPVGTSGRALNMLSGGIDSPVAAYRMAKRGLALDHIHFASPPYTSERAKLKVKALAQLTSIYTGSSNLFVVPYTKPQEYIRDNAPRCAVHGAHAPQHDAHCQRHRKAAGLRSTGHRREPGSGGQPDRQGPAVHRRRTGPAHPAPAHRHGQDRDRGDSPPHQYL